MLTAARARSPSTPASRAPDCAGAGGAVTSEERLQPARARRRGRRPLGLPRLAASCLEAFLTNRANSPVEPRILLTAHQHRRPTRLSEAVSTAVPPGRNTESYVASAH